MPRFFVFFPRRRRGCVRTGQEVRMEEGQVARMGGGRVGGEGGGVEGRWAKMKIKNV